MLAKSTSKADKLADRVAWHNPKIYDRIFDPVELKDLFRGMANIFTIVKLPKEKMMNIETF